MNATAPSSLVRFDARRLPRPVAAAHALTQALVSGLVGHRDDVPASLLPQMSFRLNHHDIPPDRLLWRLSPGGLHRIDVAVHVHGLLIDEQNWEVDREDSVPRILQRGLGWEPLLVRYNTGLHIWQNGDALALLLEDLAQAWGPRLGRIAVLGHSMGGLVARSALHALQQRNSTVLDRIDDLFLLATPNHGAHLERVGQLTEHALHIAESAPAAVVRWATERTTGARTLGESAEQWTRRMLWPMRATRQTLAMRSDGIRDVCYGYMLREECESHAHDSHRVLLNHRRPLPPPEGVRVWGLGASLWPDAGPTPSELRSDGLVTVASAAAQGPFDDLGLLSSQRFAEIPMLLHQLVPASPRVGERVRTWMEHVL